MNFYDVLAAKNWSGGIPTINFFDLLFAQSMGGGEQWQTYEGTLPATISANGDDMRQYRVYGNAGGVGDDSGTAYGYKLDMGVKSAQLFDKTATDTNNGYITNAYLKSDGTVKSDNSMNVSEYIPVSGNTVYILRYIIESSYYNAPSVCFYDISKNFISGSSYSNKNPKSFTTPAAAAYVRLSFRRIDVNIVVLAKGSTIPEPLPPYINTTTPIYIGDDPLDEDEYVDYQAGKIYRMNNLWNITAENFENSSIVSGAAKGYIISGLKPNTEYTLSSNVPRKTDAANLWFNGGSTVSNGVWDGNSRTSTSDENGEVIVYYRETELTNYGEYWYRLVEMLNPYLPTDPPVPLPALPTCEGETVVDYAGQSVAPEKVVFEYKKGI